ncbi:MAG: tetratricopeptide repeat protein [Planctomycetes bacterium]|nr:tetratricopeptide repeat protein [Planctomycetota bacterium]
MTASTSFAPPPPLSPSGLRVAALAAPLLAALLAYGGALGGEFVYDDHGAVAGNPRLEAGDWWGMAFGPDHTPLANRPVACLSFCLDRALGGLDPGWLRTGNLVWHLLCTGLVFLVVRGALRAPNLGGRFGAAAATAVATTVATLWGSHPLGAEAVAYVTQRSTLLMAAGFLLALLAALRHAATARRRWRWVAVLALAAGMASKEDLVAGPLLYVLFERAFVHPSWRAMRPHLPFLLAIAGTWTVLAACVGLGPANVTVGYGAVVPVTAFEWLYTQAGVVLHYLRLAIWPVGLCTVYDGPIVRDPGAAVLPGVAVLTLFALAVRQWFVRPWLGWLGALFFLLLGPTSSVLPIVTEVAAERRMYLPLLAVLMVVVLAGRAAIGQLAARAGFAPRGAAVAGGVVAAVAAALLVAATRVRALDFTSLERFWGNAYAHCDPGRGSLLTASILSGQARVLDRRGDGEGAFALLEQAMRCEARMAPVGMNYAVALRARGRLAEAERALRGVLADFPDFAPALGGLAAVLVDRFEQDLARGAAAAGDARLAEALERTDRAYRISPDPQFLNTRGMALCRLGRFDEAERVLRLAILQSPGYSDPYQSLGAALLFAGRPREAIEVWRRALPLRPDDAGLRMNLVAACLQLGERRLARELLAEVRRLDPTHAEAQRLWLELEVEGR